MKAAGTPISKLIDMIGQVERLQAQVDGLSEVIQNLARRLAMVEATQAREPPSGASP